MSHRPEINPLAWVLWLGGVTVVPLTSRNPFYLTLDLLVVLVVLLALPSRSSAARAWRLFATIGSTLALVSIVFNVLTVHVGDRTFARIPDNLPIIGGNLTWNAFVYGVLSALAIATLLIGAAAFNTAVRQGDMIRLMPARFTAFGIAGSIAMTMAPQTITAARDIYDAQRARGLRFRSLRDARSLVVPLLGTGLERALVLSEALEARGFGAPVADAPSRPRQRVRLVIAVSLLLAALALLGLGYLGPGLVALVSAAAIAISGGSASRRSQYRPLVWNTPSLAVAVAAALSALIVVVWAALTPMTLAYDPFPRLTEPPFNPAVGSAILLLLAPVIWTKP